ncbi:MATE family efflux transporter [Vibrio hannami]|uniref:MATE family efflux transporter n=1 Tax=Vibrio hannami TaxID=2717094 RepID=UPI00240EFD16|nr:MATE family efflux transporter [Vibrio hannami]MDG3085295.1 MATE family efflux transporter [Vibrio hannami]
MELRLIRQQLPLTIIKFAIPSIFSMILTSSLSIIDGYFIGNFIGKSALSAVNIGLPFSFFNLAIGIMVGVGGVSQASQLIGANKHKLSNCIFNQTLLTGLVLLVISAMLSSVLISPISEQIKLEVAVRQHFIDYYSLIIFAYPLAMLNVIGGMFVRAEGNPNIPLVLSIISVVLNASLDYTLVVHFNFGVKGIAIASVISVLVNSIYLFSYIRTKSRIFNIQRFVLSRAVLVDTFKNGSSEFIGQFSICITTITLNHTIVTTGGVDSLTAYTLVNYSGYLFTMIVIGLAQASATLVGYSYGASDYGLAKKVRNFSIIYVTILGLLSMLFLLLNVDRYSLLFIDNNHVGEVARSGIPYYSIMFLFVGTNIITSFYYTSVGNVLASTAISAARGLVILLACILILPKFCGVKAIWLIAPTTELLTFFISCWLLAKEEACPEVLETTLSNQSTKMIPSTTRTDYD